MSTWQKEVWPVFEKGAVLSKRSYVTTDLKGFRNKRAGEILLRLIDLRLTEGMRSLTGRVHLRTFVILKRAVIL